MEHFKLIENITVEKRYKHSEPKVAYKNCRIKDFRVDDKATIEDCIFFNCHIRSMKFIAFERERNIIFLNCKIRELNINKCYSPSIKFIGCEIVDSEFNESNLSGITFKRQLGEKENLQLKEILQEDFIPINSLIKIIYSTFQFCDMNSMQICDAKIMDTAIKHCHIDKMEVRDDLIIKNVDFRGTKISGSNLGESQLINLRFKKGFYFIELISLLLSYLLRIKLYVLHPRSLDFRSLPKKSRCGKVKKKMRNFRRSIKILLYKSRLLFRFADYLSSTDLEQLEYKKTDFLKERPLLWYIKELESIQDFKRNQPRSALISFLTTNYLRSISVLLVCTLILIFVFSIMYSSNCVEFKAELKKPFLLSVKVFMNRDTSPLHAGNDFTEILMTLQMLSGYFVLGILLVIIINKFSRKF